MILGLGGPCPVAPVGYVRSYRNVDCSLGPHIVVPEASWSSEANDIGI